MEYMENTREVMRKTILGKIIWKPCPNCAGSGYENWDENGKDIRPGKTKDIDRDWGKCENCNDLGFVISMEKE